MFPWQWGDELKAAYEAVFNTLMQFVGQSINFDNLGIVVWLFSVGYGVGIALSLIVAVVIVPMGFVMRRFRLSAVYAFAIAALSAGVGAVWFIGINASRDIGNALTRAAQAIGTQPTTGSASFTLPDFTFGNVLFDAFMFAGLFLWSFALLNLFVAYGVMNALLTFFGLPVIYAYGLGPRTRKLMSIIIAMLLVTNVTGMPAAIAIIRLGNTLAGLIHGGGIFWVGIFTIVSMWIAVAVQFLLFFAFYKSTSHVMGRLNGEIRGLVRSRNEGKHRVDANVTNNVKTTTNQTSNLEKARQGSDFKKEVIQASAATAAAAATSMGVKAAKAAVAAGSNIHPAVKAATIVAPIVIKGIGSLAANQASKPKGRSLDVHR